MAKSDKVKDVKKVKEVKADKKNKDDKKVKDKKPKNSSLDDKKKVAALVKVPLTSKEILAKAAVSIYSILSYSGSRLCQGSRLFQRNSSQGSSKHFFHSVLFWALIIFQEEVKPIEAPF